MVKKNRKICVVTGSRAEYGLLKFLMDEINNSESLELILLVTGTHLSKEFGFTVKEIENDGFQITDKVDISINSDSSKYISRSIGTGLIAFADKFDVYRPDLLIVLGDRYEIFSAVVAAHVNCIPIAHIHGGEITQGVIDDSFRHGITKMSNLHFVAADEYRKRVIQLGEHPDTVFKVGALGVENIRKREFLDKEKLESALDFIFGKKNLLVTFHPLSLDENSTKQQIIELLGALNFFENIHLIFTMPNADTNFKFVIDLIKDFCNERINATYQKSLGQNKYFSCLKYVDGVIGNSSSGIIEVPSFKKGTINVGERQEGRLKSKSIIDCKPYKDEIIKAIEKLYSLDFKKVLENSKNPYGEGGASKLIIETIKDLDFKTIKKKKFYDLNF